MVKYLALGLLLLVGYGKARPSNLTDKQKVALLREEVSRRHLHFIIFCTNWMPEDDWQYQGEAGADGSQLLKDTQVQWVSHGSTEGETAYKLYKALQSSPNEYPSPPEIRRKHKCCERSLSQ